MTARKPPPAADLARRLAEAEATIAALLSGQIDAVVDSGSQTPVLLAKAQEALRDSEERYRSIVETTNEGIALLNADSTITFVNRRFAAMLGYAPAEMIGRPLSHIVPEGAGAAAALRMEHSRQGISGESEVAYVRKDGTALWTLLKTCPIRDTDGAWIGTLGMITDRTRHREDEEALRRSTADLRRERDRAQRYLDTADVILLALDLKGRITLANRFACSILGWTADELLGRDWVEMCLPVRLRDLSRKRFHDLVEGDLTIIENAIVSRSGEERVIEWRNTLLRDDEGHVTGTFSSGADITERSQAIETLRTTEERMRFALKNANVGIWDMDYNAGVVRWSEILESQYGLQPGTFGGTFAAFIGCIHPDDRASVLETLGEAAKSGTDFSVQHRSIRPDGTVRWLSGAGRFQLGADGTPVRGVGISQDVTERRALEGQYQQSQKMEAVGRLAGGIAHDFNNLLSVILSCGEFLLDALDPVDPARVDAEEICKAGQRAAALTRQLLMFSRQQVLDPRIVDLAAVPANMESMLRRVVGEDVELVIRNDERGGRVRVDAGSIEQVIMNLVVNARDAMPTGGTLTIETRSEVIDDSVMTRPQVGAKPGRHVVLAVTDTGTGMDQTTQARIFEPFFTSKDVGKGTGLGLSTVFGIVEQSHGAIRVQSAVGKGTTFSIYLPQVDAAADAGSVKAPMAGRRGTETILLVEDEEQVRAVARAILQRQGYHVIEMRSAAEALGYCQSHPEPIHLLLTDVVMPQMSGPELARRLVHVLPRERVLYMSGYPDDGIVRHGVLQADIAFLQKPFTYESLTRKVREVLDRGVVQAVA